VIVTLRLNDQEKCFILLKKHYKKIKREYLKFNNKVFAEAKDFSQDVQYVNGGTWNAMGIYICDKKLQDEKSFPTLYKILDNFPYKMIVSFMVVGAGTEIGDHTDKEKGWKYHITLDDGGGSDSGMDYNFINNEGWPQIETHIFKEGETITFKPEHPHNGWNKNPRDRLTLLIDFYCEKEYNDEDFKKYYNNYNKVWGGLDELYEWYEKKKKAA
jgi:hypothetical protein